jgi:hypothetical protein
MSVPPEIATVVVWARSDKTAETTDTSQTAAVRLRTRMCMMSSLLD